MNKKSFKIIIWLGWAFLVSLWNFGFQEATPLLDVEIALVLSLVSIVLTFSLEKF